LFHIAASHCCFTLLLHIAADPALGLDAHRDAPPEF
jgi:hypothetical protein